MSTRCHVEFMRPVYKKDEKGRYVIDETKPATVEVRLYHHSDGYPEFQLVKVVKFLEHCSKLVTTTPCYWWDNERVAAMFCGWSMGSYEEPNLKLDESNFFKYEWEKVRKEGKKKSEVEKNGTGWGVPKYQPCSTAARHGDVEFVYQILLTDVDEQGKVTPFGGGRIGAQIECYRTHYGPDMDDDKLVLESVPVVKMMWPDEKVDEVLAKGKKKEPEETEVADGEGKQADGSPAVEGEVRPS